MFAYLSLTNIIIMGVGVAALVGWIFLYFASAKYNSFFAPLSEKEYPLKELYGTGYALIEKTGYKYHSRFDRSLRADLSIMYEEKYVEYYLRVVYAQSITFGFLVFLLSFILYGLTGEIMIFFICLMMAGLAVYYYLTLSQKKVQKRSDILLNQFSEAVSKLALLVNAGMILKEAWTEVAYAGNSEIELEMQKSCEDMSNGISEAEAIRRFGARCRIQEAKKFSSTIIQGIEKGNRELAAMLQNQSDEVWEDKQQRVRRQGAQANTKLMVPMFIMFIGVLIMIVIPIFMNLGV